LAIQKLDHREGPLLLGATLSKVGAADPRPQPQPPDLGTIHGKALEDLRGPPEVRVLKP
jgi:hypothetical protein